MAKLQDYINGKITYDENGQYFWINQPEGGVQMLAELRGWGRIQNMFSNKAQTKVDVKKAGEFQDMVGRFLADAINEKLERDGLLKI